MGGITVRDELAVEARVFARYLVRTEPAPELVARYADAMTALFPEPPAPADAALVRFACDRPWSVPFLDAASGLVAPSSRLRAKILVMAAILETTPALADEFLPRNEVPLAALAVRLAGAGLAAVGYALGGFVLLPVARRSRG